MYWNQYFRIGKSCQSLCQDPLQINIWGTTPLLVTYILATSYLNFIWYLMTILRLCMQEKIKKLQFGQNWSLFNLARLHMMMSTMFLTFLMSGWIKQLWKPEDIMNPRGTPRSQFSNVGIMIQEIKTLYINQTPTQPQLPSVIQFQQVTLQASQYQLPHLQGRQIQGRQPQEIQWNQFLIGGQEDREDL